MGFFLVQVALAAAAPLIDGTPQRVNISQGELAVFQFLQSSTKISEVMFSASPIRGNIRLYIKAGSGTIDPSSGSSYQWASEQHYSGEPILVHSTDSHWPIDHIFTVGVFAVTNAECLILATTDKSTTELTLGVPQRDSIDEGENEYFSLDLMPSDLAGTNNCSLSITVTSITGDPDLYVSRTVDHPNSANHADDSTGRASLRFGSDEVVYDQPTPGLYHIGVSAWRNSTFSVATSLQCVSGISTLTHLVDGIPQTGLLEQGQYRYYDFSMESGQDLGVSLSKIYGDPDIFVRNDGKRPTLDFFTWKAASFGADFLSIGADDPKYCTRCTYIIGVYGSVTTSYTLYVSSALVISTLQEGVPRSGTLQSGKTAYYQIPVAVFDREMTITVTNFGLGDPDIFISTKYQFPNFTASEWSALQSGSDSVTIPHTDPKACSTCTYYIAVRAFIGTSYTIAISFDSMTQLQDGMSQHGTINTGATKYYRVQVITGHGDLTVALSTTYGQVQLVMGVNNPPLTTNPTWASTSAGAVKTLTVLEDDPNACRNTTCSYIIGVVGIRNASYDLTAATAMSLIPLQPGVPAREHVNGGTWEYFSFRVDNAGTDISVVVTAITGDPDLFVSHTHQKPTADTADFSSRKLGGDIVDIDNATLGDWYIGVTSVMNSTFTVTVVMTAQAEGVTERSLIRLYLGEPQHGTLKHDKYRYFKIQLPELHDELTFSLSPEYGDPDLYIRLVNESANWTLPTKESSSWSSSRQSSDMVTIKDAVPATYIVGVYAFTTCAFTLTANTKMDTITLQDSVPLRARLDAHELRYYQINVVEPGHDLTISITPFEGDPDMFVSTTVSKPGPENYTWSGISYMADSVTIAQTDPKFCVCTYYIAVLSFTASSYTIVASFSSLVALRDGVPQTGSVEKHAFRYYRLNLGVIHTDITFSLTPIDGNPALYVSTDIEPNEDTFMWRTSPFSPSSTITVRANDPNFCKAESCTYYVGVTGYTGPANYSISATTSSTSAMLQNGIPVRGWVDGHTAQYFTFQLSTPGLDTAFVLTPITGDPDLYVSMSNERPSYSNSNWSSQAFGADAVALANASAGTYYIGVSSVSNASFTVTAYITNPDDPRKNTLLVDGVPQSGIVAGGNYKYYHLFLQPGHRSLEIAVSRRVGDPDLFVSNNGTLPTRETNNWASRSFGTDKVVIPNPPGGEYIIGVHGFTAAMYELIASTDNTVEILMDGVPFSKSLAGGLYDYFQIPVDRTDEDLTVTVTPLGDGDPDLFISAVYGRPNITSHEWSARNYRDDSITISSEKLKIQTYYVSVYAFGNCSYTIVSTFRAESHLGDGVPQAGTVHQGASNYYNWAIDFVSTNTDLTFTLTPYSGLADLYISQNKKPTKEDWTSWEWSSVGMSVQSIIIRSDDHLACKAQHCNYHAMVVGRSNVTLYSILASTAGGIVSLQTGIAQQRSLQRDQYSYFSFNLDSMNSAVTFTLTPLSGDPDLYVSTSTSHPSRTNYTWKSTNYGADVVTIDVDTEGYQLGVYWIAVYAFENSLFTLTATVVDLSKANRNFAQRIPLYTGVPQVGYLGSQDALAIYTYQVNGGSGGGFSGAGRQDVTITVTPQYGDPDIYVSDDGSIPNSTHSKWSAKQWGRDSLTIPAPCATCSFTYTIGVQAFSNTLFSIVVSTSESLTRLQGSVPIQDTAASGEYRYFVMTVDRTDLPLVVSCTALSGDPDLFISRTVQRPNSSSCQYCAVDYGDDVVSINNLTLGNYYIAVKGGYQNSTFTLTATVGAFTLIRGQPHKDKLDAGGTRMYAFTMNGQKAGGEDVVITLSSNDNGNALLYVNNNGKFPTATQYQWSSANAATGVRNSITVPSVDPGACFNCTYKILVVASSRTVYSITASLGGQNQQALLAGVPTMAYGEKDDTVYFRAYVDSSSQDINVDVTAFLGSFEVYVSHTEPFPSATKNTWKAENGRTAHISIPRTDPNFNNGIYYIAIVCKTDARFSVTLATHNTMLKNGAPQTGSLKTSGSFFFLNVDSSSGNAVEDVGFAAWLNESPKQPITLCMSHTNPEPSPQSGTCLLSSQVREGEMLMIGKNQPASCKTEACSFYIGVFGSADQVGKRFTVKGSTDDAYDILLDGAHVHGAVLPKAWKYYEMWIAEMKELEIKVSTCSGNVDLYVSKDTYKPDLSHYQWRSSATNQDESLTMEDFQTDSSFYIGVYGDQNSTYQLSARTSATPAEVLPIPGDQGKVDLATPVANAVRVSFTKASHPNNAALKYYLYYSKVQENKVMYSVCGAVMSTLALGGPFKADADRVVKTIEGLEPQTKYLVNIIVEDDQGFQAPYSFASIEIVDLKGSVPWFWFAVLGVPVLICIVGAIAYLLRKNRKLTKELEIEMHDVPSHALRKAVAGPPTARKDKPYSNLLAADDDDSMFGEAEHGDDDDGVGFYRA